MSRTFELKKLQAMTNTEFLLMVLGSDHETELVEREIREYTRKDYESLDHADGTLSEIIGRDKGYCEYRQLARIRKMTDSHGNNFSDDIKKSLETFLFTLQSVKLQEDCALLEGIAKEYDYVNNESGAEIPARFEAYWPFPSKDSTSMMR